MRNSLDDVVSAVWAKKFAFFGIFFVVFFCTYLALTILDVLPEPITTEQTEEISSELENVATSTNNQDESQVLAEETRMVEAEGVESVSAPQKLYIPSLERTLVVLNPVSRTIADLDKALLDGVVRHPDSALLGQSGTVFILGHSSYLPSVLNKNFQAFNGIQNLKWGDTIELSGDDGTYVYRVERVYSAKAQEVVVPIAGETERLVLATCNSFGSIDDRHIVEAELVTIL